MKPNATKGYDSTPAHLRTLIERAGVSQLEAARRLGVDGRTMRYYLANPQRAAPPYCLVFALECLAS